MSNIDTSLNITEETFLRGTELIRLITTYIREVAQGYFGHRPVGADDIKFPCVMVEPVSAKANMYSTGKYDLGWTFQIYYYIPGDNRDDLLKRQVALGEALIKLFSNNALGDLLTANPPSNKFKTNPGFWLNSEIIDLQYSSTFLDAKNNRAKYMRAGLMVLSLEDRKIK